MDCQRLYPKHHITRSAPRKRMAWLGFLQELLVRHGSLYRVCVSLVTETVLEDAAKGWIALLIVLRLRKLVTFIFDLLLAHKREFGAGWEHLQLQDRLGAVCV